MKLLTLLIASMIASNVLSAELPKAEPFGKTADGTPVEVFTLSNSKGVKLRVMTFGAIVLSLETPDRSGRLADIALGYKTLDEYIKDTPYFGAVVGRYGNRIANGKFTVDGKEYSLATNNNPGGMSCSLHGGLKGFDKVVWKGEPQTKGDAQGVKLHYVSKDGEEGYPGTLSLTVTYWLTEKNEWMIEYQATTDKATPVNVTQHTYFNLKGEGNGDILDHQLMLAASKYTPVTIGMIPTGEFAPVAGTPFDFLTPHAVGERIGEDFQQLKFGGGYDHNFILDNTSEVDATLYDPATGRLMEVITDQPGIQFYSGNFLKGTLIGFGGKPYNYRSGLCLETQHFPDSPNHSDFPTTVLNPGETMKTTTIYRFSIK